MALSGYSCISCCCKRLVRKINKNRLGIFFYLILNVLRLWGHLPICHSKPKQTYFNQFDISQLGWVGKNKKAYTNTSFSEVEFYSCYPVFLTTKAWLKTKVKSIYKYPALEPTPMKFVIYFVSFHVNFSLIKQPSCIVLT